ncbi:MAG: O-methyltransferase [Eubacterium sp.]|nr:O-methyltransferase [Eubacterium sp.]
MKDRIDVFLDKYRTPLPSYLLDMEKHAREHNIPVIERGTGDILRYVLNTVKPKSILEIGTAIGFSALFMRECLPGNDVKITTIEKIEARYEQAQVNFDAYDTSHQITLIRDEAADAIRRLKVAGEKYQVIFLDAAKGQYISFLPTLLELLEVEGVLVSDNVFHEGTVMNSRYAVNQRDRTIHERLREYLKAITDSEQLESLIIPVDDGVAISKRIM